MTTAPVLAYGRRPTRWRAWGWRLKVALVVMVGYAGVRGYPRVQAWEENQETKWRVERAMAALLASPLPAGRIPIPESVGVAPHITYRNPLLRQLVDAHRMERTRTDAYVPQFNGYTLHKAPSDRFLSSLHPDFDLWNDIGVFPHGMDLLYCGPLKSGLARPNILATIDTNGVVCVWNYQSASFWDPYPRENIFGTHRLDGPLGQTVIETGQVDSLDAGEVTFRVAQPQTAFLLQVRLTSEGQVGFTQSPLP